MMLPPADPHETRLLSFLETGDWAALARYWMAHQYGLALEHALLVCRQLGQQRQRPQELALYLKAVQRHPLDLLPEPTGLLSQMPSEVEEATIRMLFLFPRMALCENVGTFPVADQNRLLQLGLESASRGVEIASWLDDLALTALCFQFLGRGYQEQRDLIKARDSYLEALTLRRRLAKEFPEIYRSEVAMTLNNLGNVLSALRVFEPARDCYREALAIRQKFGQQQVGNAPAEVAMTQNNLGNVLSELQEREAAADCFCEALETYRRLASLRPEMYGADVAMTLNNLGNIQRDQGLLAAARDSYGEALQAFRELAQHKPGAFLPHVATTLHNLGTVQRDLRTLEAARRSYHEALAIRRTLVEHRPDFYGPEVALTLNNLGNVLSDLQEPEAARDCYHEARQIRSDLAHQRPDLYRLPLAKTLANLAVVQRDLGDLEAACASLQSALEQYRELSQQHSADFRRDMAATLSALGEVQGARREWGAARTHFQEASQLYQAEARDFPDRNLSERLQNELALARLCLTEVPDLGWPDLTTAAATLQRARCWAAESSLGSAGQGGKPALLETLLTLQVDLWQRRRDPVVIAEAWEIAELRWACGLSEGLAAAGPEGQGGDLPRVRPISLEQARRHIPTDVPTAFVQFLLTQERALVLILTQNRAGAVVLPEFPEREAHRLAQQWQETVQKGQKEAWDDLCPGILQEVAIRAVRPVVEGLLGQGIRRLVLLPDPDMGVFPLHACPLSNGRLLIDHAEICYLPSLSLLHHCVTRSPSSPGLVEDNPVGDRPFANVLRTHRPKVIPLVSPLAGQEQVSIQQRATVPLLAGASGVLGSLWDIDDLSDVLLQTRFHEHQQSGHSPATSLRLAMHWLRHIPTGEMLRQKILPGLLPHLESEAQRRLIHHQGSGYPAYQPPFSSPFHWASLTYTGVIHP